jgi:hypothetical protein
VFRICVADCRRVPVHIQSFAYLFVFNGHGLLQSLAPVIGTLSRYCTSHQETLEQIEPSPTPRAENETSKSPHSHAQTFTLLPSSDFHHIDLIRTRGPDDFEAEKYDLTLVQPGFTGCGPLLHGDISE